MRFLSRPDGARRPVLALFALAVPMMAALTGCSGHAGDTLAQAQSARSAGRPVGVVLPKQGDVARTITQPATIQGIEEASLYARASGYLKSVDVDKGDRVQRGAVLAVIESPE